MTGVTQEIADRRHDAGFEEPKTLTGDEVIVIPSSIADPIIKGSETVPTKPNAETAHLYQVEDGWMETFTGQQFFFRRSETMEFRLEDIAHALSMQCRYGGHTKIFYSVAEHVCLLSDYVLNGSGRRGTYQDALDMLHHDDSEAYLHDLARPIKHVMPEYLSIEKTIEASIAKQLGLTYPMQPWLKALDSRILVDERAQLMGNSGNNWGTDSLEPLGVTIRGWSPERAKAEFMARHWSRILGGGW